MFRIELFPGLILSCIQHTSKYVYYKKEGLFQLVKSEKYPEISKKEIWALEELAHTFAISKKSWYNMRVLFFNIFVW